MENKNEYEMKECGKCDRLTNVSELKQIDNLDICHECQTVKKIN